MQHLLITGAGGNLGRAVANRFLGGDYRVSAIKLPGDSADLPSDVGIAVADADLNDEEATAGAVSALIGRQGPVQVAVLAAGGFAMGDLSGTSSGDIRSMISLNFETAYHVVRPVFLHMCAQGYGRIFLVGARPAMDMKGSTQTLAYGLSKSLLLRLAEVLNEEGKQCNVVVTVVVPSIIDTPQNRASMPDADFTTWMDPAQMAEIIYFYASPAADGLREPVLKMWNRS